MREITVNGRIAKDVAKNVSATGKEFIKFSLANNEFGDKKGADGKPITCWFSVISFNPDIIRLAQYFTKGKPINVIGQLQAPRIYTSSVTNEPCVSMDIVAHHITFEVGSERTDAPTSSVAVTEPRGVKTAVEDVPQVTRKVSVPTPQPTPTAGSDEDNLPF